MEMSEMDAERLGRSIQKALDFLVTMKRRVDLEGHVWGDKDVCAILKTGMRERDIVYEELASFEACEHLLPHYLQAVLKEAHAKIREQAEKEASGLILHAKGLCPLCAGGLPVDMETRKHTVHPIPGEEPNARCLAFPWRRAAYFLQNIHLA